MPWNNEHMLTDADGNFIPQVWDPSQNKFVPYEAKVQLSGKKATQIDTILNAVSIPPGGRSEYVNMGLSGDERYVLVAVAIDKQPWAMRGRTVFGVYSDRIFFPHKSSYTQTYTTTIPMVTLLTGSNDILDSYEQVLALSVYDPSMLIGVLNNSSEIATCTLKVVRKW